MRLSVQTPAEKLAYVVTPPLIAIDRLSLKHDDWLVVCGGFEDRATGILERAIGAGNRFKVLLIRYEPVVAENRADAIRQTCHRGGIWVQEATYNRHEPAGFGRALAEVLSSLDGRVFVDVSAMSRLLIVQILVALHATPRGFAGCSAVYTEARSYPPTKVEAKSELARSRTDPTLSILFLSSGVFDVTIVPELSSAAMSEAQTRLIAFPSLDAHHLDSLRVELQPSRFSFIEGVPPSPENQWRREVISQINHLDGIVGAEKYEVSTLRYEETLKCLLNLYSKHAIREKLLISPTGSKMQAVAVGIFRSIVHDVQIVYPTAHGFNAPGNYTVGVGQMHELALEAFAEDDDQD